MRLVQDSKNLQRDDLPIEEMARVVQVQRDWVSRSNLGLEDSSLMAKQGFWNTRDGTRPRNGGGAAVDASGLKDQIGLIGKVNESQFRKTDAMSYRESLIEY